MDSLPPEMICEIASHLNGVDLVSFSMVNKDINSILEKKISKDREKYKFDIFYNYNKHKFNEYVTNVLSGITSTNNYCLKCLLCFRKKRIKCPYKIDYFICGKFRCKYNCDFDCNVFSEARCNCERRRLRELIINGVDYDIVCKMTEYVKYHECGIK